MSTQNVAIVDLIKQRPPFLFIDELIERSEDQLVARTYVDPDWSCFQGHFPDEPIMPGVLLCETCFQAGALLMAMRLGETKDTAGTPVVTRIQDARFKRIVRPGEDLTIKVCIDDELDGAAYMTGWVSVADELAVRVKFAVMRAGQ